MSTYRPRFRPNRRSVLKGTGALAVGLTFLPRFALAEEEKKLNLYNYDTYIGDTTLDDFEAASGIAPKMDLFADMDELFSKLKAGNPGYDAVVVANDYLERMVKANLMMPLDHTKIPNMANIDPAFTNPAFDPGRKHSIPYMWGTIGVGYRKSAIEGGMGDGNCSVSRPDAKCRVLQRHGCQREETQRICNLLWRSRFCDWARDSQCFDLNRHKKKRRFFRIDVLIQVAFFGSTVLLSCLIGC